MVASFKYNVLILPNVVIYVYYDSTTYVFKCRKQFYYNVNICCNTLNNDILLRSLSIMF